VDHFFRLVFIRYTIGLDSTLFRFFAICFSVPSGYGGASVLWSKAAGKCQGHIDGAVRFSEPSMLVCGERGDDEGFKHLVWAKKLAITMGIRPRQAHWGTPYHHASK